MLTLVESSVGETAPPRSQTSLVYAALRRDILAGRLKPGEKLKVLELTAKFEVSSGAVREALSRLVPEELVVSRDQKGFVVAPLSIDDLQDLTTARCEVEAVLLRRSVERGDAAWEGAVLATAHQLRRTAVMGDEPRLLSLQWVERHAAFHTALVSACGSRRLMALHHQLYDQSERYRGLSVHVEGGRDVDAEHQALVDAALDRDADALVALTTEHLQKTTALIVEAARRAPSDALLAPKKM